MEKRRIDRRRKGGKAEGRSLCPSAILLSVPLWLCAACAAVKPAQQSGADRSFYRDSSRKMGISFSGTEDRALIKASSEWMGTPYRYGGVEKTGVDCSGFVLNVFREAYGVTLPRTSAAMARQVQRVSRDDLQSGDLLFFTVKDKRVSHVGIYMADNKFVHSSSSYGVSVASLGDAYWSRYFAGAGRVDVEEAQVQQEPAADSVQRENRAAAHRRTSSLPNRRSRTNGQDTPAKPDEASAADTASAAADKDDDVILVFDEEF